MSTMSKALAILGGFMAGVVVSFFGSVLFIHVTYRCQEGPPCDAGAMTGIALWFVSAPFVGAIFAYGAYRIVARSNTSPKD